MIPHLYRNSLMLGNLHTLSSFDIFFSKLTFSKNSLKDTVRVSNGLDPDHA